MTVTVLPPVVIGSGIRVGSPITLNASLGRAGLWTGEGPPGTIVGAAVGDDYLDTLTGNLYRLDPGV